MMKLKIGLIEEHENDEILLKELLDIMHVYKLDYTNTFIDLKNDNLKKHKFFEKWLTKYSERRELEKKDKDFLNKIMKKNNPNIIPRNHIVDKLIKKAENNNFDDLYHYLELIKKPYNKLSDNHYLTKLPKNEEKIYQTFCGT